MRVGFGFRFLETAGLKDKAGQATQYFSERGLCLSEFNKCGNAGGDGTGG